jgi:hypothetical protein
VIKRFELSQPQMGIRLRFSIFTIIWARLLVAVFLSQSVSLERQCPICEFASSLWQEESGESKKMAKSLFVRQRFFSPVIVRGEEDAGVRIWGYGKTIYENSSWSWFLNPDYGDITDVDNGVDFALTTRSQNEGCIPANNLSPKRKSSPLLATKKEIAATA